MSILPVPLFRLAVYPRPWSSATTSRSNAADRWGPDSLSLCALPRYDPYHQTSWFRIRSSNTKEGADPPYRPGGQAIGADEGSKWPRHSKCYTKGPHTPGPTLDNITVVAIWARSPVQFSLASVNSRIKTAMGACPGELKLLNTGRHLAIGVTPENQLYIYKVQLEKNLKATCDFGYGAFSVQL